MSCKINNDYGEINIETDVIARIAGHAAMDCYGIVGMASKNVKDGIVQLLKRENVTRGVSLATSEAGIIITLHIIVEYGTNIPAICESLIGAVQYNIESYVGLPVEKVDVFVDGLNVAS